MKKTFFILSIDGGGILGLYSADVLAKIQEEFCNNEPLSEHFNLITGTSTGGIIALALGIGNSAARIKEFYIKYGEKIFPKARRKFLGIFNNKYSNKNLKLALQDFFEDKTVKDCKCAVCVPSVNVATCQPIMFKTNNNGTQTRDENFSLVDIAMATSSAPTYFPIYEFGDFSGLVDGGLWQNNPALFGVIEAVSYFVGEGKDFDSIKVLSIGNPNSSIRNSLDIRSHKSNLIKWNSNLVSLPMKISSIATDNILSFLHRNKSLNIVDYLRIECDNLPQKFYDLKLDSADAVSYKKLQELSGRDFNSYKDKLRIFFIQGDHNEFA